MYYEDEMDYQEEMDFLKECEKKEFEEHLTQDNTLFWMEDPFGRHEEIWYYEDLMTKAEYDLISYMRDNKYIITRRFLSFIDLTLNKIELNKNNSIHSIPYEKLCDDSLVFVKGDGLTLYLAPLKFMRWHLLRCNVVMYSFYTVHKGIVYKVKKPIFISRNYIYNNDLIRKQDVFRKLEPDCYGIYSKYPEEKQLSDFLDKQIEKGNPNVSKYDFGEIIEIDFKNFEYRLLAKIDYIDNSYNKIFYADTLISEMEIRDIINKVKNYNDDTTYKIVVSYKENILLDFIISRPLSRQYEEYADKQDKDSKDTYLKVIDELENFINRFGNMEQWSLEAREHNQRQLIYNKKEIQYLLSYLISLNHFNFFQPEYSTCYEIYKDPSLEDEVPF